MTKKIPDFVPIEAQVTMTSCVEAPIHIWTKNEPPLTVSDELENAFIDWFFDRVPPDAVLARPPLFRLVENKDAGKWRYADEEFPPLSPDEAAPILAALSRRGFDSIESLIAPLWSRFSQDQCATWMSTMPPSENTVTADRFAEWVYSGMDPEEAWS